MSGRNVGYSETAEGFTHTVGYKYNSDNNLIELTEDINGAERTTTYKYDDDNRTTEITTNGTTVEYTYDGFGRVTQQVTKLKGENEETPDTVILTEYFTYTAPSSTTTSAQVATYRTVGGNYDITYSYTYDANGNITSVHDGTNWIYYTYDSANQLIREDNQDRGRTYTWTYDNAGNILYYKTYAYTRGAVGAELDSVAYGYDDEGWGDLMTSYDGTAVTYDEIGNPETLNGRTYVWEHGRQLKSMTSGDVTWAYTYNNAGLRTGRVGTQTDADGNTTTTDTYEYVYNGSQLVRMIKNGEIVDITYDAAGTPLTMTYDEVTYYYVTNLQGDVVGLLDENGNKMISYRYTAYGQGFIFSDESDMTLILANINPLGYRGYVMDIGTATYYCQSRYYDPVFGRFINADGYTSTGQGFIGNNMFAYCLNNPVRHTDSSGCYCRDAAVAYALKWAEGKNTEYYFYNRGDCANFVSQCLRAGGLSDSDGWYHVKAQKSNWAIAFTPVAWFSYKYRYTWSHSDSWTVANDQYKYFSDLRNDYTDELVIEISSADEISSVAKYRNVQPGDLLYFSENGYSAYHAAIIIEVTDEKIYYVAHSGSAGIQDWDRGTVLLSHSPNK